MADWRNRMDQIVNKVKAQLFAKGVDNMNQLQDVFLVSNRHASQPLASTQSLRLSTSASFGPGRNSRRDKQGIAGLPSGA